MKQLYIPEETPTPISSQSVPSPVLRERRGGRGGDGGPAQRGGRGGGEGDRPSAPGAQGGNAGGLRGGQIGAHFAVPLVGSHEHLRRSR